LNILTPTVAVSRLAPGPIDINPALVGSVFSFFSFVEEESYMRKQRPINPTTGGSREKHGDGDVQMLVRGHVCKYRRVVKDIGSPTQKM